MATEFLQKITNRIDLSFDEASILAQSIFDAAISEIEIAAIISSLQTKGLVSSELTAFATVARERSEKLNPKVDFTVDMCGTGGDMTNTFNISTTASFLVAASGLKVAKHGNRSISSQSGSADLFEALGFDINLGKESTERLIEEKHLAFIYAPLYHKAFKNLANLRKILGIRTIFNLLGPLINPANPSYQLVGIYDKNLMEIYINTLKDLGLKGAMVVHGNGMDELTLTGENIIYELIDGKINKYTLHSEDLGLQKCNIEDLKGGNVKENAEILKNILSGKEKGPRRDIVLLNAAAMFKMTGKVVDFKKGIELGRGLIDGGEVFKLFPNLLIYSI